MIKSTLKHIKEQTGIDLDLCQDLPGIRKTHKGNEYFNVVLKGRSWDSQEFNTLERFANDYKTIKIEPNGMKRVAIYPLLNA